MNLFVSRTDLWSRISLLTGPLLDLRSNWCLEQTLEKFMGVSNWCPNWLSGGWTNWVSCCVLATLGHYVRPAVVSVGFLTTRNAGYYNGDRSDFISDVHGVWIGYQWCWDDIIHISHLKNCLHTGWEKQGTFTDYDTHSAHKFHFLIASMLVDSIGLSVMERCLVWCTIIQSREFVWQKA